MVALAEGHRIVTVPLTLTLIVTAFLSIYFQFVVLITLIMILLTSFSFFFFRDPDRHPSPEAHERAILSPADGKVVEVLNGRKFETRIQMSLFNVHVNRSPITGIITKIERFQGRHWPFFSRFAAKTTENTRQVITIRGSRYDIQIVQVCGFLARRCVSYLKEGERVHAGQRIGMIRMGSEVDVLISTKTEFQFQALVSKGDTVRAGESVIALEKK